MNGSVNGIGRRQFISKLSAATAALGASLPPMRDPKVKAISGSWFEFQHHATVEGVDWNPACACFSCAQWDAKIREMSEAGLQYLVLMATALYYRAFYKTSTFPPWRLACSDPIDTVLSAADKYNVKFFIGGGFYGDWADPKIVSDPIAARKRLQAIEELAKLYGHHRSFYGWYWPNEAFINPYYSNEFIQYVNACSKAARQLMPGARILIAPYGTRVAAADDKYVKQLESMDVDIVAYQDEVGVRKSTVEETAVFYERLHKAHTRVPKAAIWADVEIFEFEGEVYHSPVTSASFDRVLRQLEAVSPWVDTVLVYQYLGLMNKPGSAAFAGPPESTKLYTDYVRWLNSSHHRTA
ncbi:MAG: DUF4434 domain-containing protein [Acidobacteriaceae bacterium]|nr:DUF4434 domain-containing protein [Acidobacteriaceae bacterium]